MQLRYYQSEAIEATLAWFGEGKEKPLVVLPTGTGKSLVQADMVRNILTDHPHVRIILATHSQELVFQNYEEILSIWPECPAGIFSSGLKRREAHKQVLFCGIQSVYSKAAQLGHIDLIIVDEAHTISRKSDSMWGQFFSDAKAINPNIQIMGLTATDYRLDSGNLVPNTFDGVAYEYPVLDAIKDGYLCEIVSAPVATHLKTNGVQKRGGEFVSGALERAVDTDELTLACVEEIVAFGQDRRSWLVFAAGNKHAQHITDALISHGIDARCVTESTSKEDRRQAVADHKSGALKCLVNNMIFTTGYNNPRLDLIACMRPTQSQGLWVQICGRGMRLFAGKENCIAEGQRVLTDHGLVEIQNITKNMKVWDGLDFVSHDGIVFKGEREVVTYAGLTATPDHKVWTKKGWMEFKNASINAEPIYATGNEELPIKLSDCYFRNDTQSWSENEAIHDDRVSEMFKRKTDRFIHAKKQVRRMSKMWAQKKYFKTSFRCSQMALVKMQRGKTKVCKQKESIIQRLWRQRDSIQIRNRKLYGEIYNGEFCFKSIFTDRQDRQQWSLRNWEFKADRTKNKCEQPKEQFCNQAKAFIQAKVSRRKIRGFNPNKVNMDGHDGRANHRQVFQSEIKQAKRRVWDILNAGPRHRFTCEGLLVSNCLLLDFGRNLDRHGPIDQIKGKAGDLSSGDGEAPLKQCPACFEPVYAAVRTCPACGFEFPPFELNITTKASDSAVFSTQIVPIEYNVFSVQYKRNTGKDGKRDSMMVIYNTMSGQMREWVFFDHDIGTRAKNESIRWSKARGVEKPLTLEEALAVNWPQPKTIMAIKDGKYYKIKNAIFE